MTKRFTAIILIANVIMGLLLYLSSQLMLSEINGSVVNNYSLTTIVIVPAQTGQAIAPIAMVLPNYPFYVFLFFLGVNACFIVKLLTSKETKRNPS
jgi:hypothetical protein